MEVELGLTLVMVPSTIDDMGLRKPISLDVVIFGGGITGLWLLDTLVRMGARVLLLEADSFGAGQTIASQGIIHGGVKYSLRGMLTPAGRAVRDMPLLWRRCLAGEQQPDLTGTLHRGEFCHLWQTSSIASRLGMIGAQSGLRVTPHKISKYERPDVLRSCPGTVSRLDEQVIDPGSVLEIFSDRHRAHTLRIDAASGIEFSTDGPGQIRLIRMINPSTGDTLDLQPNLTVLTAGVGNGGLRDQIGLSTKLMQRRPLHMTIARGSLPMLNGHCIDGMKTRVTITSTKDYADRTVWQIGGQLAEDGVSMESTLLVDRARSEIQAVLPGIDLRQVDWATYRVDRAEPSTLGGHRPDTAFARRDGNTLTVWPIKMVLVPQLVDQVVQQVSINAGDPLQTDELSDWPRPQVAIYPWEDELSWLTDH